MVSPVLIVIAGVVAGVAVALAALFSRWPTAPLVAAAAGTFVLVVAWRLVANALSLNDDFMPAVSVGDVVCLLAGGIPPAVVAVVGRRVPRKAVIVLTGAVIAFAVNVVIL